jgi:hypothetical protein
MMRKTNGRVAAWRSLEFKLQLVRWKEDNLKVGL